MKQKIARKILTVTSMLLSGVMVTATVICNENATAISSALNVKTFDVVETGDTNQDSEYYKSNFDNLTDLINAGHSKATEVLEEGAVLLKNENGALPLSKGSKVHQNDEDTAHYVDSIGFQQVPEFLQEQQTPVFDKLPPEQQQALSDTVQDTLQMLVDADKRIYGDVTGKTLEAIAAQGYSYKDGQLEKQQPEATPDSLLTGETVRTPRGNFHITDMSREQIEAAGFGFHHASEDGKYLIMGNGTQAYAIAAEQPQRDNPLKHVEDTIEQNDNNFDGLINNTPQTPTVADFEQRAKAGEAISVTDLAKAVKAEKREQPQKKPSILKKLDEYKKQAAQQPKDKQKEHKKDLEV